MQVTLTNHTKKLCVIGDPIATENGVTVVPISKVTVGYASGGLDYNGKEKPQSAPQNFGAGGGTGISISPVGFLVIKKEGGVEMINVGASRPADPIEQIIEIIERSPDILARLRDVFTKKKKNKNEEIKIEDEAEE